MAKPDLSDYNDVASRVKEFFTKYPNGRLRADHDFIQVNDSWGVVVKAYAFRDADDQLPGSGLAWEPIPGKTSFTRDSELMNAETSAWGRAILAVGASEAKKIASYEEVRNRQEDDRPVQQAPPAANAQGVAKLLQLAAESQLSPEVMAVKFQAQFHVHPREATNEVLESFVNLVKAGAINLDTLPTVVGVSEQPS